MIYDKYYEKLNLLKFLYRDVQSSINFNEVQKVISFFLPPLLTLPKFSSQILIIKISAQPVPEKSKYKSSGSVNRISGPFKSEKKIEKNKIEEQKN